MHGSKVLFALDVNILCVVTDKTEKIEIAFDFNGHRIKVNYIRNSRRIHSWIARFILSITIGISKGTLTQAQLFRFDWY